MVRMGIVSFSVESKIYKFKKPLMLEQENVGDGVCLVHKGLSLSACGKSFSECEGIIREELAMTWAKYVLVSDDELTTGAFIFKYELLGMVEEEK